MEIHIPMAFKSYRTYCSTLLLIIIACQSIYIASATNRKLWGMKHKGTIKTIESDDGEVIDCVDIYKQPGLKNRPIKDLKMSPTSLPIGIKMKSDIKIYQDWHKYGECPEGTIPIRRNSSPINHAKPEPFNINRSISNHSVKSSDFNGPEYAMASTSKVGTSYHGAYARLFVWNPIVDDGEYSSSKIWLISTSLKGETNYNSIEAGWIVYPSRYKDNRTKLYTYWTADAAKRSGCYDLDCSGFIQISRRVTLGSTLEPVSTYNWDQYKFEIGIFQDANTGDWWLRLGNIQVGYWPSDLFTTLKQHATQVNFGGEILNHGYRNRGHHTSTLMGSGHFSYEGYSKSSLMALMTIVNSNYVLKDPGFLVPTMTRPECYDLRASKKRGQTGQIMFFGGPGFSSDCP